MQGLDEEGLRAYSGHLQQEFLRPDISQQGGPARALRLRTMMTLNRRKMTQAPP